MRQSWELRELKRPNDFMSGSKGSGNSRRRTLLTGFAMRSDPMGFSEVSAPLTAEGEAQALVARTLRRIGLIVAPQLRGLWLSE